MPAEDLDKILEEQEAAPLESTRAKHLRALQGDLALELQLTDDVSVRAGALADLIIADLIAHPHLRVVK